MQQQARCSIFISYLTLVGPSILEKDLQIVQIESKKLVIDPAPS